MKKILESLLNSYSEVIDSDERIQNKDGELGADQGAEVINDINFNIVDKGHDKNKSDFDKEIRDKQKWF